MSDQVIITGIIVGGIVFGVFVVAGSIFTFNVLNSIKQGWWK